MGQGTALGIPGGGMGNVQPWGFPEGNARVHNPLGFRDGEGGWVTVSRRDDEGCKGHELIYPQESTTGISSPTTTKRML